MRDLETYLTDREQNVKIRDAISTPEIVRIGVPQGTVSGPVFNLFIKGLTNIDIQGRVVSYADDTVFIFSDWNWGAVRLRATEGVEHVKNWLDTYKLTLNVVKTNYIVFSKTSANRALFSELVCGNLASAIQGTEASKYLGVIVDQNFKWD